MMVHLTISRAGSAEPATQRSEGRFVNYCSTTLKRDGSLSSSTYMTIFGFINQQLPLGRACKRVIVVDERLIGLAGRLNVDSRG